VTIRFTTKDGGRGSLARVIADILVRDTINNDTPAFTRAVGGYIIHCSARQTNRKGVAAMNIRFNLNAAGRRALANAVGEILAETVIYNRTPTFSYTIGRYIVERDGALTFPNNIFHNESAALITGLRERGYEVDCGEMPNFQAAQMVGHDENRCENHHHGKTASEPLISSIADRLTIELPVAHIPIATIESVKKIVASKETLIKKALGTDSLPIVVTDDKLCFPWFTLNGIDGEADAYLHFITAICGMAKRQRRVTAI
jgi:hypothetical protein